MSDPIPSRYELENEVNALVRERSELRAENEWLRALLRRLYEWDHMDSAGDGPFWRGEINKALGRGKDDG